MLNRFVGFLRLRNFSRSTNFKNVENSKSNDNPGLMDFKPNNFDKKVLIWSGKFKSEDSIPPRISFQMMHNARSRLRIRIANVMIVATIILFICSAYVGKKRSREGESLLHIALKRDQDIKERSKKLE